MSGGEELVQGSRKFFGSDHARAYEKFKTCKITIAKTLLLDRISHPVGDYFATSGLIFLLSLAVPFHGEMLYEFFANLLITAERTLQFRVNGRDFYITQSDLAHYLQIPNSGPSAHNLSNNNSFDWTGINQLLRDRSEKEHIPIPTDLSVGGKVIQHVVRSSLIPKAGDKAVITPLITAVTYFILSNTQFNVVDLITRNFENINSIRDPRSRKKVNLSMGHIIAYILERKYDFTYPIPPDHNPKFFNDGSFNLYYSKRHRGPSAPLASSSTQPARHSFSDDFSAQARRDHLETMQHITELRAGQARIEFNLGEMQAGQTRLEFSLGEVRAGQARAERQMSKILEKLDIEDTSSDEED